MFSLIKTLTDFLFLRASPSGSGAQETTGTITDAWPVKAGETWSSDYGELGIEGLTLRFD